MQKEILQVIQNLYFKFIGLNYIVYQKCNCVILWIWN